jgi:hypothetical protein
MPPKRSASTPQKRARSVSPPSSRPSTRIRLMSPADTLPLNSPQPSIPSPEMQSLINQLYVRAFRSRGDRRWSAPEIMEMHRRLRETEYEWYSPPPRPKTTAPKDKPRTARPTVQRQPTPASPTPASRPRTRTTSRTSRSPTSPEAVGLMEIMSARMRQPPPSRRSSRSLSGTDSLHSPGSEYSSPTSSTAGLINELVNRRRRFDSGVHISSSSDSGSN